eukprot:9483043-Pyramimonas_sp.AAC.1
MAQDVPRCLKMAPTMLQEAPRPLQDGPKWPTKELPRRDPKEAKILPKPQDNQCFWLSRAFASDGHPRPRDSSKTAQEGARRGSREPTRGVGDHQARNSMSEIAIGVP